MKDVKVVFKFRISEENFKSDEFQDFLESLRNGQMKKEMNELEDGEEMFENIKITYFINKKAPTKNSEASSS
jgi:molybdate-binding protein